MQFLCPSNLFYLTFYSCVLQQKMGLMYSRNIQNNIFKIFFKHISSFKNHGAKHLFLSTLCVNRWSLGIFIKDWFSCFLCLVYQCRNRSLLSYSEINVFIYWFVSCWSGIYDVNLFYCTYMVATLNILSHALE